MRSILTFVFTLFLIPAIAQDSTANAPLAYERKTYELLEKKDWAQLAEVSEEALLTVKGYWVFHARAAQAYYMMEEYYQAIYHYEKAMQLSHDPEMKEVFSEYLYDCYLKTSQYAQALKLTGKGTVGKNYGNQHSPVFLTHVEAGLKFSNNDSLYKPLDYFQLGIGWRINRKFTVYNAYTHIHQPSYYGVFNQHQFYTGITVPLRNNWNIRPSVHFLSLRITEIPPGIVLANTDIASFATSLEAEKLFRNWLLSFQVSYSNFNKGEQWQQRIGISHYPFNNNRLALRGSVITLSNNSGDVMKPLYSVGMRYMATQTFAVSFDYLRAESTFFNEMNGYVANNSFDITQSRFIIGVEKEFSVSSGIYINYLHESKTESYYQKPYNNHMFLAGYKHLF